jgi:ATP-dependent helicase Lhr and Lhr-like helicase
VPLERFSPPVREWFSTNFATPTEAQAQGWPAIASGEHTLICAPTGSGKTLAAFLWAIDRLMVAPVPEGAARTRLVYLSPLRALAFDIERNLRAPLTGIGHAAERLGVPVHLPTVGLRTGDTPADERRRLVRHPPDILITTPESLYLMLTSAARETLGSVDVVIVDEIHAVAATKRGAHLSLSLERLVATQERDHGTPGDGAASGSAGAGDAESHPIEANGATPARRATFQRIGLSATQRPLSEIARFLGGYEVPDADPGADTRRPRPVTVVDVGVRKELDLEVVVPVEDMGALGEVIDEGPTTGPVAAGPVRRSIWPAIHPRLLELIEAHRSTIIFTNARRLAERLATRLNELALDGENRAGENHGGGGQGGGEHSDDWSDGDGAPLVKAHHGSLAREQRVVIEDQLKAGTLRGLVATSSLELGIDMGAVDLVVLVESPGSVARGLQRVGRAGHQVGEPSRGKLFPKHRADLVEAAVIVERMHAGAIETTRIPRNPLDVLAQQIVAMCALDEWDVDELAAVVRRSANFADLGDEVLAAVLDLLSGRYPSDEFAELRPRIVWDRVGGVVRGRAGAQRLAVTSGGTIPDRGLFGVFLPDGTRVGELDEEMVYESRPGETFLLGASTWRIEDITPDRVVVTPAPGEPGKMPFWRGDGPGRPLELGLAVGAFVREIRELDPGAATERLRTRHGLDEAAARNLLAYLDEQAEATGVVPDDRTVVVEQFRDEIGDWRVCVLTPFGAQVHAPWAMALRARLTDEWGMEPEMLWSDDGIVLRLPEAVDELPLEALALDPDEVTETVVAALGSTAMFASRFRECAARSLLLPRRRPDRRTPLWQQRQRAADLLAVAAKYPTFPISLEATRECCNDVFDLPALRDVLGRLADRRTRIVAVRTDRASPMAQSLLFGWIAVYMYEGDAPLAERRAAALALDRDLLGELLGAEELRELLDPGVLADLELELQHLADGWQARDADEAHDLLRVLGPLDEVEVAARSVEGAPVGAWLASLEREHRAFRAGSSAPSAFSRLDAPSGVRWNRRFAEGSGSRWAAAEDAGRLRDAVGVALPVGLPTAFTDPVDLPLDDLVARYARTHGPFLARQCAERLEVAEHRVEAALARLAESDRVTQGEFHPEGTEREWCDTDVLRQLRRRSLAALRHEVEPVEQAALARFLPAWQGVGSNRRGVDALVETIGVLAGAPIAASVLERDVLAARLAGYRPADLDALCASGDVVWVGAGALGSSDGRVRLVFRDQVDLLVTSPASEEVPDGAIHEALRSQLAGRGACFWGDLVAAVAAAGLPYGDDEVLAALWDLVWAGEVTNDTLAPLRAAVSGRARRRTGGVGVRGGVAVGAGVVGRRGAVGRGRPRPGRLSRSGPPAAAGRWSLTPVVHAALGLGDDGSEETASPPAGDGDGKQVQPDGRPTATEVAHARALQLLERHGVLTREAALAEGVPGGFAAVYPVLRALEERGQVRRGYFVAGLGGAQFALPGAVDRLRHSRHDGSADRGGDTAGGVLVLAATDPAQPYGAALAWPASNGRPARTAGAYVVLADGKPLVLVERGGRGLVLFEGWPDDPRWPGAVAGLVRDGPLRSMTVARIDGAPVGEHPAADRLVEEGFVVGYRGLVLRR